MSSGRDSGGPARVLVCDEEGWAHELAEHLRAAGHRAEPVAGGEALVRALRSGAGDVLVCDPEAARVDVPAELARIDEPATWIQLSGFASMEDALEAVRRGAFEHLQKPCEPEQVLLSVTRALESRSLRAENRRLRDEAAGRVGLGALFTRDERVKQVLATAEAVARSRAGVLIEGESGTGKTLLARAIHAASERAAGPFVEVHCGAIPPQLLESELFGAAKGAYTGSVRDRAGRVELAHGGTLFLDEVGTATPELQVRLLRVLQERTFERVGETRTRTSDLRVVAATNEDLHAAVSAGRFREDLYWRLCVVRLALPPLRERPADVPLLAERFLERLAREHAREARAFSPAALAALLAHGWPGNVRELEHRVERAVLLARGTRVEPADLDLGAPAARPAETLELEPGSTLRACLERAERSVLEQALSRCDGNRTRAAILLDIDRTTLHNKLRKHGLVAFPRRSE